MSRRNTNNSRANSVARDENQRLTELVVPTSLTMPPSPATSQANLEGTLSEVSFHGEDDDKDDSSLDLDYTGFVSKPDLVVLNEDNEDDEELTEEQKKYNKGVSRTFLLLITMQIIINYDSGAIAYSLLLLKTKWDMNETEAGLLTSLVYIGLVISSLYAGFLFMRFNPKYVLAIGVCINIVANVLFGVCPDKTAALLLRVIIGMSQAFLVIYAPVWVDEFAPSGKITLWMSLMQGGVPIGIMLGYLIAGIIVPLIVGDITTEDDLDDPTIFAKVMLPYFMQSVLLLPLVIGLVLVPDQYIDTKISMAMRDAEHNTDEDGHKKEMVDILNDLIDNDLKILASSDRGESTRAHARPRGTSDGEGSSPATRAESRGDAKSSQADELQQTVSGDSLVSASSSRQSDKKADLFDQNNVAGHLSMYGDVAKPKLGEPDSTPELDAVDDEMAREKRDESVEIDVAPPKVRAGGIVRSRRIDMFLQDKWPKIWVQCKYLIFNGLYLSCVGALCSLYFVVTGIQMWITRYLTEYLQVDPMTVTIAFSVVSATGPLTGVIVGGIVMDKLGGYRGVEGMITTCKVSTVFGVCAVLAAYTVIFVHNFWANIGLIWILLAFGGGIVPGATGVLMSSVPSHLRAFASSAATLVYNLFGYFLGPTVCGVVAEALGGVEYGFWIVCGCSIFGAVAMASAWYFAYKNRYNLDALQPDTESLQGELVPMNAEETMYEVARKQSFAGFAVLLQQSRKSRVLEKEADYKATVPKRSVRTSQRRMSIPNIPTVAISPDPVFVAMQTDMHRSESARRKSYHTG
ncbi:hypothetical protein SARC_01690 [Sphaeroforma arctica JP610]|uniref:Major facilitator superfamily (MFS) profile domain-containing protein n=1 Tax=Sphaeroforma arctica JP610 TaxID=667725 RepID=A0A0L0GB89_9EUKA|nr:hypothetical protein SARC_01690 [Sphaeroforma arctica JP610]KNC86164.1 hypothetical protein SARC_01690 [Sphaeroforma arctica JP610]|eukprot:XP_014160066.1 hypothetical protein SARC_01690 [Sphaeroforma arctica JP610]